MNRDVDRVRTLDYVNGLKGYVTGIETITGTRRDAAARSLAVATTHLETAILWLEKSLYDDDGRGDHEMDP